MIDTHLHLDDEKFDGTREEIIDGFAQHHIEFVINNSCDFATMQKGVELANNHDKIFATVGMHPHDAKNFDDNFVSAMTELARNPKVVAVGEIGLDYFYDLSDRQIQRDVFAEQIEIADKLKLPLTLHIRDAYGDAQDILQAQRQYLNSGVLWHCYSGSAEFAKQMAKRGHYFAFGGAITFKNANKGEVAKEIPFDRILSETDSPYMAPVPLRGMVNSPYNLPLILEKLAEFYNVTVVEVEEQIHKNTLNLFPKIAKFFK